MQLQLSHRALLSLKRQMNIEEPPETIKYFIPISPMTGTLQTHLRTALICHIRKKKENLTNVLVSGWYDFDAKYTVKGSKGDFEAYVKKEETYNDIERHIRLYTFEEGDYGWFNVTSNGIYKFDQLICPLTDFERQDTLSYSLSEKRQTGIERITGSTKKANDETVTITAGSWKFDLVREGIDIITVYDSSDPSTSLITLSRQ